MPATLPRSDYAAMYGPTTGDKVRLADTDLIIEVERDHTTYGEEVKFGGGKVIRDGMGQSQVTRAEGAADTVITNALILDHSGIVKGRYRLRDGRIAAIGKAGNPDTQPGVDIIIGPGTEAIAGEGKIVTAGGFDSHIHFICPQQIEEALLFRRYHHAGRRHRPGHGTNATTCTPGAWHIGRMLQAFEAFPMNLGVCGKGNASLPALSGRQVAPVLRLKLHEDWGTTPAAIDCCLCVADDMDVQVMIHTDTLNESGFVENTVAAFKGRTIHAFHTEGRRRRSRAGHHQGLRRGKRLAVVHQPDPPLHGQYAGRTSRHADGLPPPRPSIPEDVAFAESRIRARPSRRKTSCTTWARFRSSRRTPRPWAVSAKC